MIVRRALAAMACAIGLGLSGAACPSRELGVTITAEGASTLILACESFRDACKGPSACVTKPLLCELGPSGCVLRNACDLPDAADWSPAETMAMSLLLLDADEGGAISLQKRSACVPVNFRPCIRDPSGVTGCPDGADDATGCVTDVVSAAVRAAIGSGLGFDGFRDPGSVLFTAAFFHQPGSAASCDPAALVGPGDCAAENLVAAAGIAAPFGSDTFDITCASCRGGPRSSVGRDNGACPVRGDRCFLQQVAAVLAASP